MRLKLSVLGTLACLACLLLPNILFAQDFRPGYIIKNNGDSLSGFAVYATEKKNTRYCEFRQTRKGETTRFSPDDLLAYGFYGDKQYLSMRVPELATTGKVFLKVLSRGPLNLYEYQEVFLVKKDTLILLPTPKAKVIETSEGKRSKEDSRYKGLLNFLIADCKMSADEIKYAENDLTNLANNYNRCQGAATSFKKPKPIFKSNFQLSGGYVHSNMEMDLFDQVTFNPSTTIVGGLGADLSSPRIFDRMFFTIEVWYVKSFYQAYHKEQVGYETIHRDIFMNFTSLKFPVGFRYNFLKESNTPYIKAGITFNYLTDYAIKTTEEREMNGIVSTRELDGGYEIQSKPKGIWFSVGYNKTVYRKVQLFGEFRYERVEGFIGTPVTSFSNVVNYNLLLGVRF